MNDFKRSFVSGVFYTSVAKYIGIILQIFISAILARLLKPEDFGIIAVATVIIGFITLITDFGLAPSIIQKDNLNESDIKGLFSLSIYVGIVGSLILLFSSHEISEYYDDNELIPVIQLLSLNVLFASVNIVPNALLLKAKKFKLIAIRTLLMQSLGGTLAIIAAFIGFGLYSLVINTLFAAIGVFVFNYWHAPIRISFWVKRSTISKVFAFSAVQFFTQIITYVNGTLDKLMVGKYMGLSDLGYYEKSYKLMRLPVTNLTYVFTPVMQPLFKDYKNDLAVMERKYSKLLRTISIIGFPLSVYLYFEASDLICSFYGMNWMPAIRPFQLFGLSAGFMMLLSSTGPIYQASHSLRSQMASCVGETSIGLICLFVGLSMGGLNVIAMFVSVGIILRFFWSFGIIYICIFKKSISDFFKYLYPAVFYAMILAVSEFFVNSLSAKPLDILRLIISTVMLGIIILTALHQQDLLNLKHLATSFIKKHKRQE